MRKESQHAARRHMLHSAFAENRACGKKLPDIRDKDVSALIMRLQKRRLAANTIRLTLAILSYLYIIARQEWSLEILINPAQNVRKPKLPGG